MFQIIKLITFTTSGGAYLNFIGNEFAHPKVRYLHYIQNLIALLQFQFCELDLSFFAVDLLSIFCYYFRELSFLCQAMTIPSA